MQRGQRLIGVLFFSLFFTHLLTGCNKVSKEKLLRTFFDGVPDRKEEQPAAKEEAGQSKAAQDKQPLPETPVQYFHPPFLENQCHSCHDVKSSQRLTAQGKVLCFSCHDDFTKDKKTIHYPAEEGDCTGCHDPHQSMNKYLLKEPVPETCFSCHDIKEVRENPAHKANSSCTQCHDAHASDKEKLLK